MRSKEGITIFGYTRAYLPELRFKEYDKYKAYYCGVCREIGRAGGTLSRFSLTYESAVLAMLLDFVCGKSETEAKSGRCMVHPLKKHPYYAGTPGIYYAARVNVLLFENAAADKWEDERSLKGKLSALLLSRPAKKAGKNVPDALDSVAEGLAKFNALEKAGTTDLDTYTAAFGTILAELFTMNGLVPAEYMKNMHALGMALGQWIVLADACKDRDADRRSKAYNICNLIDPDGNDTEAQAEFKNYRRLCINDCRAAWERIKTIKGENCDESAAGFFDNLFGDGLRSTDESI